MYIYTYIYIYNIILYTRLILIHVHWPFAICIRIRKGVRKALCWGPAAVRGTCEDPTRREKLGENGANNAFANNTCANVQSDTLVSIKIININIHIYIYTNIVGSGEYAAWVNLKF